MCSVLWRLKKDLHDTSSVHRDTATDKGYKKSKIISKKNRMGWLNKLDSFLHRAGIRSYRPTFHGCHMYSIEASANNEML